MCQGNSIYTGLKPHCCMEHVKIANHYKSANFGKLKRVLCYIPQVQTLHSQNITWKVFQRTNQYFGWTVFSLKNILYLSHTRNIILCNSHDCIIHGRCDWSLKRMGTNCSLQKLSAIWCLLLVWACTESWVLKSKWSWLAGGSSLRVLFVPEMVSFWYICYKVPVKNTIGDCVRFSQYSKYSQY